MKTKRTICLLSVLTLWLTTGCWDAKELKDRAIILGSGLDAVGNGVYQVSAQIVVPTKVPSRASGGGDTNSFLVKSSSGVSIVDATQRLQAKLSREAFLGHRHAVFIGEAMARRGIADVLDEYTRNPEVRLRTDMFVVEGSDAKHFLLTSYPLESFPVEAALKGYTAMGGSRGVTLRNFLVDSTSDVGVGVLPAIRTESDLSSEEGQELNQTHETEYQIAGTAIFKDFKLVGFLNHDETCYAHWIVGNLKKIDITAFVPEGNGKVSIHMEDFKHKVQPIIQGDKVEFIVTLTGSGSIRENNTNLDLTQHRNLEILENRLSQEAEKHAQETIIKVQKDYGTDIFGFGEQIMRSDPRQWRMLKSNWRQTFSSASVSAKVQLRVTRVGITGPSLQLHDNEIRR